MSVFGIGTDIVDISRIESKMDRDSFIQKVFTPKEIQYCNSRSNPAQSFAARFAAKEAYMKALGTGWSENADFIEIETLSAKSGAPYICLHGKTKECFESMNLKRVFISLSHSGASAIAFVILSY